MQHIKKVKVYYRKGEENQTGIETELLSNHGDYFDSPVGGFQFTRDIKNEVSGFIIKDLGRVRNLVFSRAE